MPISLPAAFQAAIATSGPAAASPQATVVVEVDGFPFAFSNRWLPTTWLPSTAYLLNQQVCNGGNLYVCVLAGTSAAASGPGGTGSSPIVDGTCQWRYLKAGAAWYSNRSSTSSTFPAILQAIQVDQQGFPQGLEFSLPEVDHTTGRAETGQVTVQVLDLAGTLAPLLAIRRTDGQYRLRSSVTAYDTSFTLDPTAGVPLSAIVANQTVLHLGREAVLVTAIDTTTGIATVTRGWRRTTPAAHNGGDRLGAGKGDLVTPYPQTLIDRRVWIRFGYNAQTDADCLSIFAGSLRSYGVTAGGKALTLQCEDQTRLAQPLFSNLNDSLFDQPTERGPNNPQVANADFSQVANQQNLTIQDLPYDFNQGRTGPFFCLFGNSIALLQITSNPPNPSSGNPVQFNLQAIGLYQGGYVYDASQPTLAVRPVIVITHGSLVPSDPEFSLPWLYGVNPDSLGQIDGGHPLLILLQLLISTGARSLTPLPAGTSFYDTLPAAWGLGIPEAEIDVAGILALAQQTPNYKVRLVLTDQVDDARDWITKELLLPFGWFLVIKADGTIGVGSLADPEPAQLLNMVQVTQNDLATDPKTGQFRKFEGPVCNGDRRIVAITWADTPYLENGQVSLHPKWRINVADNLDGLALSQTTKPLEINSHGLHSPDLYQTPAQATGSSQAQGFGVVDQDGISIAQQLQPPVGAMQGYQLASSALLTRLQSRYSVPPYQLNVEVRPLLWGVSLGDLVQVSIPNLPSPFNTTAGWTNVVCEVTKRRPLLSKGTLELQLTASGLGSQPVRYFAPCLIITGAAAGQYQWNVQLHAFSASPQTDLAAFTAGLDVVRVYSSDRLQRSTNVLTITALDAVNGQVTFSGAVTFDLQPSRTVQSGDLIMLADYTEQVAADQARYAYRSTPQPGAMLGAGDPPDVWA